MYSIKCTVYSVQCIQYTHTQQVIIEINYSSLVSILLSQTSSIKEIIEKLKKIQRERKDQHKQIITTVPIVFTGNKSLMATGAQQLDGDVFFYEYL